MAGLNTAECKFMSSNYMKSELMLKQEIMREFRRICPEMNRSKILKPLVEAILKSDLKKAVLIKHFENDVKRIYEDLKEDIIQAVKDAHMKKSTNSPKYIKSESVLVEMIFDYCRGLRPKVDSSFTLKKIIESTLLVTSWEPMSTMERLNEVERFYDMLLKKDWEERQKFYKRMEERQSATPLPSQSPRKVNEQQPKVNVKPVEESLPITSFKQQESNVTRVEEPPVQQNKEEEKVTLGQVLKFLEDNDCNWQQIIREYYRVAEKPGEVKSDITCIEQESDEKMVKSETGQTESRESGAVEPDSLQVEPTEVSEFPNGLNNQVTAVLLQEEEKVEVISEVIPLEFNTPVITIIQEEKEELVNSETISFVEKFEEDSGIVPEVSIIVSESITMNELKQVETCEETFVFEELPCSNADNSTSVVNSDQIRDVFLKVCVKNNYDPTKCKIIHEEFYLLLKIQLQSNFFKDIWKDFARVCLLFQNVFKYFYFSLNYNNGIIIHLYSIQFFEYLQLLQSSIMIMNYFQTLIQMQVLFVLLSGSFNSTGLLIDG